MSPSGRYVIAQYTDSNGTRLYDRNDLSYIRTLVKDHAHSDLAVDGNGDDAWVFAAENDNAVAEVGNRAGLASVRLADGKKTILLESHWWWAQHISGIGSRRNHGWVLISTYMAPGATQRPYGRELLWLKMDGTGEVRRIAHHHSDESSNSSGKDYWAEPQATSSWDGRIAVFSSVWGSPFNEYDLYTVTGDWFGPAPPVTPSDDVPPAAPTGLRQVQ
jgi:hypothetical protein